MVPDICCMEGVFQSFDRFGVIAVNKTVKKTSVRRGLAARVARWRRVSSGSTWFII